MAGNSNSGGSRKNAGRKSNGKKLLDAGFVAPWLTAEFQKIKWIKFVNHEDPKVSLDAMKYVTNRVYGMPTQAVDMNANLKIDGELAEALSRARKRSAR